MEKIKCFDILDNHTVRGPFLKTDEHKNVRIFLIPGYVYRGWVDIKTELMTYSCSSINSELIYIKDERFTDL